MRSGRVMAVSFLRAAGKLRSQGREGKRMSPSCGLRPGAWRPRLPGCRVNAEGDEVPTTRRRLLVGTGLASLLAKQAGAAPASPARPDLPIGMLFPFSGTLALFGDESFRGLELATRERNAAGGLLGRQVRLVRAEGAEP